MSTLEIILTRVMSDSAFADQLFANPEQALTGFELTAEESTNLKNISREDFDKATQGSPEERKSFGISLNHNQTALVV